VSLAAAREVGRAFDAIDYLQLTGLITDNDARQAMKRLRKRAERLGVFIAITSPMGERLFRQIRVHWGSRDGRQINRYYPNRGEKP
jgi:hypothetical protein